jgi:uncharacterized protein
MGNPAFTNRLAAETSPYLLQHAHNPVDWYPWGDEALTKARTENKLLIVSIGYSACHWCHVMERESFEDDEVARLMNEYFVCIKVDREERPDVDALYMDAVNIMTGHGGWPLNAFALPDGRPVYAGTYFPKPQWLGLLRHMAFDYKKEPQKFEEYAAKLIGGIKQLSIVNLPEEKAEFDIDALKAVYASCYPLFDRTNGGKGRAPKFPMPDIYRFLLRYHYITREEPALNHVELTLDKMAKGGIYDQIGGGFARYSTDTKWLVPHFEKMLYDNAQLMSLYAEAWQVTKKPLYKKVVYETAQFIERELMSPESGFYCALDADSEGVEGKFYIWTEKEFNDVVSTEDAPLLREHFGIDEEGYWEEDNNILVAARDVDELAVKYRLSADEIELKITAAKKTLLAEREKRTRPGLDNKILLSWNALALIGFVDAHRIFGDEKFLETAKRNFNLLQRDFVDGTQLYRTSRNSRSPILGFLEDYAFYIAALIKWYQATFDEIVLHQALALMDVAIEKFGDTESGMFFFTAKDDQELVARKIDTSDNVMPSPNSVMAQNLYALGRYFENDEYLERAKKMLSTVLPPAQEYGPFYSNWASLLACFTSRLTDVAVVGRKAKEILLELEGEYHSLKLVSGKSEEESSLPLLNDKEFSERTMIYVCENRVCSLPVKTAAEALKQLRQPTA